eukprot:755601_1
MYRRTLLTILILASTCSCGPFDFIESGLTTVGNGIVDTGNTVGDGIVDGANTIGDGIVDAGESGVDTAVDAGNTVGDGIVDGANTIGDGIVDAGESGVDTAVDAGNTVGDGIVYGANIIGDGLGDAADWTGDMVIDTVDKFRRLMSLGDITDLIDQIPGIATEVFAIGGEIENVLSQVGDLPSVITDELGGIPSQIEDALTDEFTKIFTDIESGFGDFTSEFEDLLSKVDDFDSVLGIMTEPIDELTLDTDEAAFAATLHTCMDSLMSLIGLRQILDTIIDLPELDSFPIEDMEDIAYSIVAKALYFARDPIEWVCTEAVPFIVSFAEDLVDGIDDLFSNGLRRRRRRLTMSSDTCSLDEQNGLCMTADISNYTADGGGVYGFMLQEFTFFGDVNVASDADELAIWRLIKLIVETYHMPLCDYLSDTLSTIDYIGTPFMIAVEQIEMAFKVGLSVVDYAIESADFHDGMILTAGNDAILQNTKNIIQNQHELQAQLMENEDFIEGLTLGSVDNSYGGESIDIGQTRFNTIFRFSGFNIIKRECLACDDYFKVIYYRRFTQLSSFDVYGVMKEWTSADNVLGTDFGLYSTLQDALSDINRWQSCNYDVVNV